MDFSGVEETSSSLDSTVGTAVHYERLLTQVHELQDDLGKTLSVAQRLRTENTRLRESYEEVCLDQYPHPAVTVITFRKFRPQNL